MWLGTIVLLLSGNPHAAVEIFASKAACEKEVASVKEIVVAKNHPEMTFLFGKCEEVK